MAVGEKATKEEYSFFGEFERHPKGGYRSEMPAWCFPRQLRDLREELVAKEEALAIPGIARQRPELGQQVEELKQRIFSIENSKPKLTGKQKDDLSEARKGLIDVLKDTGETYSDMMSGRANAHRILDRQQTPYIPVNKEIAEACGVKTTKGKVSAHGAAMVVKILSYALGEDGSSQQFYKNER